MIKAFDNGRIKGFDSGVIKGFEVRQSRALKKNDQTIKVLK